jgi:hypothetical protein
MKTISILVLLTFQLNLCVGQTQKAEFEGKIYYTNSFKIKQPTVDSIQLIKNFGSSSIYTYKRGQFIWTSQGSNFQYEIYKSISNLLVDKYADAKTLNQIDVFNKVDSLISYTIIENADSICGYNCNAIRVVLQSMKDKSIMKRTIYYSSQLAINPDHFKNYRSYANNRIYPLTKSIPLRIVTEFAGFPVEITMNATKVEQTNISDTEFKIDKSLIK